MGSDVRPRVAQVGPDRRRVGGMAAVIRDILSSPLAERYQLDPVVTYRGPGPVTQTLVFTRALVEIVVWCRGDGARLVHVHTAVRGSIYRKALTVAVASAAGRPVLLHLHAGTVDIDRFAAGLGRVRRLALGSALRRADRVISVSARGAERLAALFGLDEITVIPNAAPDAPGAAEGGLAHDRETPRALYMGGFRNPAKGGAVLVAALRDLHAACPKLEIVLAGTGTPPPELLGRAATDGRVRWEGWVEGAAKEELLASCDVFVMPSLSEGLPVALLEALTYGRPIVASDVGGIPEVVENDREALLVPPGDPAALSEAVARLVADANLRQRLSAAARLRARQFGRDAIYARIGAVYEELLAAQRPTGDRRASLS